MAREDESDAAKKATESDKFYLPAASIPNGLEALGRVLTRPFSPHGVVLIPTHYNE